ncbi:MAG: alpha/beta fold hydrolase [Rhodothermales bacterium]|nr:alpha/beta fold hydrolase [Rhodothermales bacterium]
MKSLILVVLLLTAASVNAQSHLVTDRVVEDPEVVDTEYPPAMMSLRLDSEGNRLNGLIYLADGPGPHPVVLLLHGFPGNEKNLDLAQAMRRSGVNVVFFHYRGSWGSGGTFGFANAIDDVANVLATVRDTTWAREHRSDPNNVGIVGHSFGSFLGAKTVEGDNSVACLAYLDGWDVGANAISMRDDEELYSNVLERWQEGQFGEGGPLQGDAMSALAEIVGEAESYSFDHLAPSIAQIPLLIISATRAQGRYHDSRVMALQNAGAEHLTEILLDDDHSFSTHRIELAQLLVDWMSNSCWN